MRCRAVRRTANFALVAWIAQATAGIASAVPSVCPAHCALAYETLTRVNRGALPLARRCIYSLTYSADQAKEDQI